MDDAVRTLEIDQTPLIIGDAAGSFEFCPKGAEGFTFAGQMLIIDVASSLSDMVGPLRYQHVSGRTLAPLIEVSAAATGVVSGAAGHSTPLCNGRDAWSLKDIPLANQGRIAYRNRMMGHVRQLM